MRIERTYDKELIKGIMSIPEIWATISEPGEAIPDEYNVDEAFYLIGLDDDNEVVGLFIVHDTSIGIPQCHVQVIPEKRKEHTDQFGRDSIDWIWSYTYINKMMAFIPEVYPNVKAFSERMGFVEEGFLTKTYRNELGNWLVSINKEG